MPLGSSAGVGAGVDLKDSEDVKVYLDNLGIEYRFGCYHEKNPKSCHLLADYWEAIKKDFSKAYRTYETNCLDYNHGHSCAKAGGYRYFGKACQKDPDMALDFFKKGCGLGYHKACMSAGLLEIGSQDDKNYIRTEPPNPKQGLEFLRLGCEEGHSAESGYRYSSAFLKGRQNACEKNFETAFKYSVMACELGSMAGCTNTAIMYRRGDGVAKNEVLAKEYADVAEEMMTQLKMQQQIEFGKDS